MRNRDPNEFNFVPLDLDRGQPAVLDRLKREIFTPPPVLREPNPSIERPVVIERNEYLNQTIVRDVAGNEMGRTPGSGQ